MCAVWHIYTMRTKRESPTDVERWFRTQTARLWPVALGSLSLRRSPCVRDHCAACAQGDLDYNGINQGTGTDSKVGNAPINKYFVNLMNAVAPRPARTASPRRAVRPRFSSTS